MTVRIPERSLAPAAGVSGGSSLVIVVEDNDTDAYLIQRAARELLYDVDIQRYATMGQAISGMFMALRRNPVGAVLDLNLPGGSGLELLRVLRSEEISLQLPVVVMTSSISTRDRQAAEELGIRGYVLKPNNYREFLETIDLTLGLLGCAKLAG